MIVQSVNAATVNPEVEYAGDNLGRATFFLFFIGYISMGAAFVFFMSERNNVAPEFRTTMTISALIVGIAAFHYYYMRGVYIDTGAVSTDYRYMDWIITVPLMALKFPSLVGKDAITDNKVLGLGFTGVCFVGALIMISFGYLGETGVINEALGLILGGVGWAMIMVATGLPFGLYDGLGVDNSKIREELVWSTNALRTFILVGWIIYPLGYLVGTEMVDAGSDGKEIMAILYNVADMINKIGFGIVAWMGAKKASSMMA
jgi:bacteriorhodopsin